MSETVIVERPVVEVIEVDGEVAVVETQVPEVVEVGSLFGYSTSVDRSYVHTQAVASSTWVVNHGFGKVPSIVVIDSANREVVGVITHNEAKTVSTVTFTAPFGGFAHCN